MLNLRIWEPTIYPIKSFILASVNIQTFYMHAHFRTQMLIRKRNIDRLKEDFP